MNLICLFWVLGGYLAGSLPTAYLVAKRFRGIDIRTFGSGNVGATNLGRLMGKKWAVFVSLVDMFKGGIPVILAHLFADNQTTVAMVAVASVLGHNYPVWLDFKGGKGVATTYGTLFFVSPWASFFAVPASGVVWYLSLKISGYVSLASIVSLFSMSLLLPALGAPEAFGWSAFLLALLSSWRHRSNLVRIYHGKEDKVGR